jgi:hypothetical protein
MAFALAKELVELYIADCTEAAVTVGVWIVTPTITLPGVTANSTAVMGTLARAAIAVFISVRTSGVNEETSPPSRRENATTLVARFGHCSTKRRS